MKREGFRNFFKDAQGSLEVYKTRYAQNPKKAALRMAVWSMFFLFRKKQKEKKIEKKENVISIAFYLRGGYGDYLIFANWLQYFLIMFEKENIKIYVIYQSKSICSILEENQKISLLNADKNNIDENDFDIIYQFSVFPYLKKYEKERINKIGKNLIEYVNLTKEFLEYNQVILEHDPILNGWSGYISLLQGRKRYQQPDIGNYFGITEKFIVSLPIYKGRDYLKKLGLTEKKFITIHRGWDSAYKETHMKAWSLNSCGNLIKEIKKSYPQYNIVVFGESRKQACDTIDADLDLVEKTSLEDVKVLLKYAILHIDNEGGMVHLRHALEGGTSIVMFGPTSEEFFGYSENINIRGNGCSHWCEWTSKNWQKQCIRGFQEPPCMQSITTDIVLEKMKRILG